MLGVSDNLWHCERDLRSVFVCRDACALHRCWRFVHAVPALLNNNGTEAAARPTGFGLPIGLEGETWLRMIARQKLECADVQYLTTRREQHSRLAYEPDMPSEVRHLRSTCGQGGTVEELQIVSATIRVDIRGMGDFGELYGAMPRGRTFWALVQRMGIRTVW